MKCIHCQNILVEFPDTQGQSLYCSTCKMIFNSEHMGKLNMTDNVNNPPHYNSSDAICAACGTPIECIDVTRYLSFNIGNAIKYLWRYKHKNGIEDLQKALWYIQDQIKSETSNV